MSTFSEWLEKREQADSGYNRLPVDINNSPVYISADNKNIVIDGQIAGQVEMVGPQQTPTVMVNRQYQDVQGKLQAALGDYLRAGPGGISPPGADSRVSPGGISPGGISPTGTDSKV